MECGTLLSVHPLPVVLQAHARAVSMQMMYHICIEKKKCRHSARDEAGAKFLSFFRLLSSFVPTGHFIHDALVEFEQCPAMETI